MKLFYLFLLAIHVTDSIDGLHLLYELKHNQVQNHSNLTRKEATMGNVKAGTVIVIEVNKNITILNPVKEKNTKNPAKNPILSEYLGCFNDQEYERDLDGIKYESDNDNSQNVCMELCINAGYKFAATQNGNMCFCGNSFGKYGKAGKGKDACNKICTGDAPQRCGGPLTNSIWQISYNKIDNISCPDFKRGFSWKYEKGIFKQEADCKWLQIEGNNQEFYAYKEMKYDQVKGQGLILQKGTKNVLLFDKKGFIDNTKSRQSLSGQWTKQILSEETEESVCDYKKGMIWESKPGFYFKQNSDCEWFEFRDNIEYKIFESSNLTHHKLYLHTTDYTVIIDEKEALGPDYSLKGEWIKEPTMFSTITTTALSATSMPLKKKMSFLYPGEFLIVGDYLESENGHYKAVMQLDGNFVVYGIGEKVWWASNTLGNADRLTMQHGGNLVLSKGDTVTWTSGTQRIGSHLVMQNDGNLVVYSRGGPAVWASRKDEQVDENEVNKPHVVKMKIPTYRRAWVTDDPYYKFMIKEEDDKSWSTYFDQKLYCSWYLVSSNGYHNVKLQLSKIYDPVAQWDFNPLLIYEIMEKTLITRNRKSGDVIVKGYWI